MMNLVKFGQIIALAGLVGLAVGCARENAVSTSGSGPSSSVSGGSASVDTGFSFDYASVAPASPYALIDLSPTEKDPAYVESFSIGSAFSSNDVADGVNVYWYVNWVPATESASPILSGVGMDTLSAEEVLSVVCTLGLEAAPSFDLYVVATESDWSDSDARAWTSQNNFVFWEWSIEWSASDCEFVPEEVDESTEEGGEATEEGGEATEEGGEAAEEGGEAVEEGGEAAEEGGEAAEEGGEAAEEGGEAETE